MPHQREERDGCDKSLLAIKLVDLLAVESFTKIRAPNATNGWTQAVYEARCCAVMPAILSHEGAWLKADVLKIKTPRRS
jgi:hypothetical protein